ncbi:MAG: hypothetical protein OQJ84_09235 [Xanthomonadales bacterium]|nr:hypothetical protein [Xanthomonadales bacterium]
MSLARKSAVVVCTVWSLVALGSCVIFATTGVSQLSTDAGQGARTAIAALLLAGLATNGVVSTLAWRGRKRGQLDERDAAVALRASQATLIALAAIIYAACIGLYVAHEDAGVLPAGWLYILAYGIVVVVSLVHSIALLVVDIGGRVDG